MKRTTATGQETHWRIIPAAIVLLGGLMTGLAGHASPQIEALAASAQAAAKANSDGSGGVRDSIVQLVQAMDRAQTDAERLEVMAVLAKLGEMRDPGIKLVQIHLPVVSQNPLLTMARNTSFSPAVRKQALQTLRDINARDPVLDKAIALAVAEPSVFGAQADELKDFQRRRDSYGNLAAPARAVDPEREPAARRWLNERGTPINRTSLQQAAMGADIDAVKALLAAGVDPTPKDQGGMGILTTAMAAGCLDIDTPGRKQVDPRKLVTVAQLLTQAGADINELDSAGNTPLIQAARTCPAPLLTSLMQLGAKPNARNAQGFSALSYVLMTGQLDRADALITQGARVTRKEAEKLFFEWPTDPPMKSTLERAIDKQAQPSNSAAASKARK
ncbi:ankyrin repeat domain-containing protein [Diaphorobacter caeni]|uniref:ankyrin repeat domain-containing protein n=1 Tax=Diaphorobacter caeni TaxID=2784387 RepID=UPI00188F5A31|nr:ankyrin repeat domain-containing protein [Diaphorobacter caeni]MBF5006154.1 ankyrin repeat domain-containing protein [Diaphorobacter caeni]